MKRIINVSMALAVLVLFGTCAVSAQSLGDYARAVRKNKPQTETASRHYDNDNLPTNEQLSVVGPETPAVAANGDPKTVKKEASDAKAAEEERKLAADELQKKMDINKDKIESLKRELDLDQREFRLRASSFYANAGAQMQNGAEWTKEQTQYKTDIDSKQKAISDAQQEMTELQEKARKSGMREKESDSDNDKGNK
jgi:peptidoglycan hydrolase CwlO-like protein